MPTLGVSIAVPEPWGRQLQDFRVSLGDEAARLIPTHITLLAPYDASDDERVSLEEHLVAVAARTRSFEVHLRGTGTFRPTSPVVFVGVVQGISNCEALARDVGSGPIEVETRFPYHPHVTVAHEVDDAALDRAFAELADFDCTFTVDRFHLYGFDGDLGWLPSRTFLLSPA